MKPHTEKLIWLFSLAAPLVMGLYWPSLPDHIPTHFSFNGQPDAFGSRANLLILPLVFILMQVLLSRVPEWNPALRQGVLPLSHLDNIRLVLALVGFCMTFLTVRASLEPHTTEAWFLRLLLATLSLFLAATGNYMPRLRQNDLIGFRTPWTLGSELVWRKTHDMGGRSLFFGGMLALFFCGMLPLQYLLIAVPLTLLTAVLWPVVFSFQEYKRQTAHSQ